MARAQPRQPQAQGGARPAARSARRRVGVLWQVGGLCLGRDVWESRTGPGCLPSPPVSCAQFWALLSGFLVVKDPSAWLRIRCWGHSWGRGCDGKVGAQDSLLPARVHTHMHTLSPDSTH